MMKTARVISIQLLLTCICLSVARIASADCICTMYPVFPYGGLWFHYALKTTGNCIVDYPTGRIQAYTASPEYCISSTDCGTCTSLGPLVDIATVSASDLYFPSTLKKYSELDEYSEIKIFLKANINSNDPGDINTAKEFFDNCEFASPAGAKPPVVKLVRRNGARNEIFYAVLWKMRPLDRPAREERWGYIGIEVALDTSATILNPTGETFRATVQAKDGDLQQDIALKGVLEVQIGAETDPDAQVYYIRLHDSQTNKSQSAFPMRACSGTRTFSRLGRSATKPAELMDRKSGK